MLGRDLLGLDRAFDGFDDARKLDKGAATYQLDGAAAVRGDAGLDQLLAKGLEPGQRAGLVCTHEARIPDHIGNRDLGELALDRLPVCDVIVAWRPPISRAEAGDSTKPGCPSTASIRQRCCSFRILLASAGLFASARGIRRRGITGPFGHWIGDLVAPLVAGIKGSDLKAVQTDPGFECRNRNRAVTGKLSAHSQGLAIDIAGFELSSGTTLRIKPEADTAPDPALAALRQAACGWFTTILGPGSDEAHHDHLHVDIEQHGSSDRYRICQ